MVFAFAGAIVHLYLGTRVKAGMVLPDPTDPRLKTIRVMG
jgi:hypothetical protein